MSDMQSSQTVVERQQPCAPQHSRTFEVVCVCFGVGFPHGSATTPRVVLVGKSLLFAGMGFRVIHCGPSPLVINTQTSGVFEGIPFEYTTTLRRPKNAFLRALVYLWSLFVLTLQLIRLRRQRRRTAVWLYILIGPVNLYLGSLCRFLGLPIVQEMCEWWPGEPTCSRFTRWLYRKRIFKNATGVLAISKLIERRVRDIARSAKLQLPVHRLPSIVDPQRFAASSINSVPEKNWFVWCGGEAWVNDILFLCRAVALARLSGYRLRVKIIGAFNERLRQLIAQHAADAHVPLEDIYFTGYVDDPTLEQSYRNAAALLLPLRDDDRSKTRLPNKLGEYLASGRPVITCKVGDLTDFLFHRVNAYLAEPGDEQDFAEQMISVVRDPAAARRIGAAGQETCMEYLDYRAHAGALSQFFAECCGAGTDRKHL